MDYARQLSQFQNAYDEQVNAFQMKKSEIITQGQTEEKKGEETEGIGMPVAGVALKAVTKQIGALATA